MRLAFLALTLLLAADIVEARKRIVYRVKRVAPVEQVQAAPQVRLIPITRWQVWCDRIGGLECPTQ